MMFAFKNKSDEEIGIGKTAEKCAGQLIPSYKLRVFYDLACMKPNELHNVLFDLCSACDAYGLTLHANEKTQYLNSYSKSNFDQFLLVECIFEILCQIHDEIYPVSKNGVQHFRSFPSIRNLIVDLEGHEEYRPAEEINYDVVMKIAGTALRNGSFAAQRLSDEEIYHLENNATEEEAEYLFSKQQHYWDISAEKIYFEENLRLSDEHAQRENECLVGDMDEGDIDNLFREPLKNLSSGAGNVRKEDNKVAAKSLWESIKNRYVDDDNIEGDIPDVLMEGSDPSMDLSGLSADYEDRGRLPEFADDVKTNKPSLISRFKDLDEKLFGGLEVKEHNSEKGFYGYVRLLGLITIKRDIYVEHRDNIRAAESKMHRFVHIFCRIDWLTRDGTLVAYY